MNPAERFRVVGSRSGGALLIDHISYQTLEVAHLCPTIPLQMPTLLYI